MNTKSTAQLAPPGAGLPSFELLIGRALFRLRLWRGSRKAFNTLFEEERQRIRNLIAGCDADTCVEQVLIDRVRGLEDSSRNWSIWMTLEHLRIVNNAIASTITALGNGIIPPGTASTAAVKPSQGVDANVDKEYEASCDTLLAAVAAVPVLKSKVRYAHPWFGPMDAYMWHALSGGHMRIHRNQIERILQALAKLK